MKAQVLLTNILAVAAFTVLADTQSNGVTPFENLRMTTDSSFSATAGGTKTNCDVSMVDGKAKVSDDYYVLDAELTDEAPLKVAPTDMELREIARFDVTFKASFVDEADLSDAAVGEAKIGFALTSATSASYFCPGDPKGTWTALDPEKGTGTLSVTEDAECTLHVDYDGRVQQARFNIGNFTSEWVTVGAIALNSIAVHGSGSVKSLAGSTYTIIAEVVVITPEGETGSVDIDIPPTAMADIATKLGCDPAKPTEVAEKLNTQNEKNGLTELTNYILFGRVGPDIEAVDMPVAKGAPAATSGNVAVSVSGLDVQTNVGATVKYQLLGSTNNTDWHNVGEARTESKFEFTPESNGDRYFKVQAIIEY